MSDKINRRITEKIENSAYSDTIKQFLLELIQLELRNDEGWRYSKEYERKIGKFAREYLKEEHG